MDDYKDICLEESKGITLKKFKPYAKFYNSEEFEYRYRTETYLGLTQTREEFIENLKSKKNIIGTIIMLNPGSSKPQSEYESDEIVVASADRTMKQIENCILRAYEIAKEALQPYEYIEIFNLFNLCCKNSKNAIKIYKGHQDEKRMKTNKFEEKINPETPWIWLAWGCKDDRDLDKIKNDKFIKIRNHFTEKIMIGIPSEKNKFRFKHPLYLKVNDKNKIIEEISSRIKPHIQNNN